MCFFFLICFLELSIQPTLNNVLIPRGSQEVANSPQDGATTSGTVDSNESPAAPLQAAASGIA